jgi:hypothetical protein
VDKSLFFHSVTEFQWDNSLPVKEASKAMSFSSSDIIDLNSVSFNLRDDFFSLFSDASFLAVLSMDFMKAKSVVAVYLRTFACNVPQMTGGEISHLASLLRLWSFASFIFGKSFRPSSLSSRNRRTLE